MHAYQHATNVLQHAHASVFQCFKCIKFVSYSVPTVYVSVYPTVYLTNMCVATSYSVLTQYQYVCCNTPVSSSVLIDCVSYSVITYWILVLDTGYCLCCTVLVRTCCNMATRAQQQTR